MTLVQLLAVLMIEQPIIICWKGNEDIEISCTKTTAVPKRLEGEQINRVYIDDETKVNGYPPIIVELVNSEGDHEA